jgi:WD40 repeat protein
MVSGAVFMPLVLVRLPLNVKYGAVLMGDVDPAGKVLAAGTPERVVRLWDPRAGNQSIGKLIGHSDCVRSIVLSDDGRYVSRLFLKWIMP